MSVTYNPRGIDPMTKRSSPGGWIVDWHTDFDVEFARHIAGHDSNERRAGRDRAPGSNPRDHLVGETFDDIEALHRDRRHDSDVRLGVPGGYRRFIEHRCSSCFAGDKYANTERDPYDVVSNWVRPQSSRSMIMAMPWPPPTHIDSRPKRAPASSSEFNSVSMLRAPVLTKGCPSALAPPRILS